MSESSGRAAAGPGVPEDRSGIFLSYRRRDVPGHAGRVADRLCARFGHGRVFVDVDSIGAGVDYVDRIEAAVASSAAMVVVIGPGWAVERLADTDDVVRRELESAFAAGIAVLPVLVNGATMPDPDDLPADLRTLGRRNALELDDTRFADDCDRLVRAIEGFMPKPRRRRRLALAAALVVFAAAAATVVALAGDDGGGGSRQRAGGDGDEVEATTATELSLTFGAGGSASVPVSRHWTVTPGERTSTLTNLVTLQNATDVEQPFVHYEVVPKDLADHVSLVTFTVPYDDVVDPDPVVAYRRTLAPRTTLEIGWSVSVPADVSPDRLEGWRDDLLAEQVAFYASLPAAEQASGTVLAPSTAPAAGQGAVTSSGGSAGGVAAGGSTGSGGTGGTGGSGSADQGGSGGTPTSSAGAGGDGGGSATTGTTSPPNRAPAIGSIAAQTTDEQAVVNIPVVTTDADGDSVSLTVSGLPKGLTLSTGAIRGTIAVDAVGSRAHKSVLTSGSFTVTITASDGSLQTTRNVSWTVHDSHLFMPNYIGKYGCGVCNASNPNDDESAPDISHAFAQQNVGTWRSDVTFADSTIFRQGAAPGTIVAWGQAMQFWYWNTSCASSGGCEVVNQGWP